MIKCINCSVPTRNHDNGVCMVCVTKLKHQQPTAKQQLADSTCTRAMWGMLRAHAYARTGSSTLYTRNEAIRLGIIHA